jgi:steroid 5-alpha reductase family enzyme
MKYSEQYIKPTTEMWVWPIVALFAMNTLLCVIVQIFCKRDNSWVDFSWGPQFIVPNLVIWIVKAKAWSGLEPILHASDAITPRMVLITVPVIIWGLRLATYIKLRHKSEDYRYKEMREGWEQHGDCGYYVRAYGFVYVMQGVFSIVNNSSVLYVNLYSNRFESPDLAWSDFVGLAVCCVGFLIEVFADMQLANHLKNPQPGTGKFIKTGLWRYSRHPNYFGEALMWWGLWIISLQEKYGWVTFYSAVFITLLIRYVSGVPFPEKKYANNAEFQQYCRETNCFVPWFYKKAESNMKNSLM